MYNSSLFRIVDVNLNRLAEGLRVLEDIARFTLDDASLSARLKSWRQQIRILPENLDRQVLWNRHSDEDFGKDNPVEESAKTRDLFSLISANGKRAQEALRVLEEVAKDPALHLSSEQYKKIRFELYQVQKELIGRLTRLSYASYLHGIYIVLDTSVQPAERLVDIAKKAINGGGRLFQLRDKLLPKAKLLDLAKELVLLCKQNEVLLIINDYVDIALLSQAHGLHIGQTDLPAKEARKLLPPDSLLGVSVENVAQAQIAKSDGADYLGVGAVFPTYTKNIEVLGLEKLGEICKAINLPVWGIGGIKTHNASQVLQAGACGVCVISEVLRSEDPQKTVTEFVSLFSG